MMDPSLTSVRIYIDEIAIASIKRLIDKINGADKSFLKIEVAASLMIRDSVKKLDAVPEKKLS